MAKKRTSPLDTDAAQPIDLASVNQAIDQWLADRDRIVNEELPKLASAVQSIRDLANVANRLVDLIGQILPLVAKPSAPVASGDLTNLQAKLAQVREMVCALTGRC